MKKETKVQTPVEMKYDFIKDDPCLGCKFAIKKTDDEIEHDGYFTRRYLCMNQDRLLKLKMQVIEAIVTNDFGAASASAAKLYAMTRRGRLKIDCEDSIVRPFCYVACEKGESK